MTSIAYESGLLGGVNEDVLEAMSLALEVSISRVVHQVVPTLYILAAISAKLLLSILLTLPCHPTLTLQIHIKSVISTTISKIRVNRTLGPKCVNIRSVIRKEAQSMSLQNADTAIGSPSPSSPANAGYSLASPAPASLQPPKSSISDKPFIATKDLAFALELSPYTLVETPLSAEKVTTLIGDSDDEEDEYDDTDDELESDEGEFEI
jgi:hypothetical protein